MRHKIEKTQLGAFLREHTKAQREALAKDVFNPEKIRDACTKAAADGFSGCTIKPPLPVNLRQTEAVKAAEVWLAREGLNTSWALGRDTPDGLEYPRLEVSW